MICVCNTSPITNLAAIGQLELLSKLYGQLFVPDEVARELAEGFPGAPGFVDVTEVAWIHAQPVDNRPLVASLLSELDLGEAAAIALANERAALLLIDERRGRQVAARFWLAAAVAGARVSPSDDGHCSAHPDNGLDSWLGSLGA